MGSVPAGPRPGAIPHRNRLTASRRQVSTRGIPRELSHFRRIARHLQVVTGRHNPEMYGRILISGGNVFVVRAPCNFQW